MDKPRRDLKSIMESRKALFRKKPEAAMYRPKTVSEWKGGLLNENSIREHSLTSDYPVPSGGTNQAANPMEIVLAAVGSCVNSVYVEYAAMLDIELESVKVETEAEIDLRGLFNVADVHAGYQSVTYNVTLKTSAPKEKVDELIALAEAHCPVTDSLKRPVELVKNVTVEPA